ncbi:MAG: 5'-nucleotidase C-terminal domain-containing protein, partial [Armatimonadetes bacterium]|nr:5'-nucleotidase C-terminal domain-containing protein [Armatimonadota bacterium]
MRGLNWKMGLAVALIALVFGAAAASAEVLGKTTGALDAKDARTSECSLGNLVADAARTSMGAEVALVQASQLRPVEIPKGDVTREALMGALLYPDENIVLVELTGEQLRNALERSLSMLPKPNTGFLQVSGMHVTYRSTAPDARVAEMKVAGVALVESKTYKVAMPASLAKGALGYFRVFGNLQTKQGPSIGQATADFVL